MKRPDRHNEIEINLLSEGTLTYLFGGSVREVPAGQLCVFWASIPHQIVSFSAQQAYHVITLPLAWFLASHPSEELLQRLLCGEMVIDGTPNRATLDGALMQQWHADFNCGDPSRLKIALREIEARLCRMGLSLIPIEEIRAPLDSVSSNHVEQITRYIASNYTSEISVKSAAEHVGLHPNYVMGLFRKTMGTTLNGYIGLHRITHAQRLLVTTELSVLEIALQSGFGSLSRFNAAFKEHSGCSPRQFRNSHRIPGFTLT